MSVCVFCNVHENERNKILKDYPLAIVLMANQRKVSGQLLVIPKRHVERFSELNANERKQISDIIADTEKRIVKHFKAGCDITQHYRPYIEEDGYKVSHLHIHILPRYRDDVIHRVRNSERALYRALTDKEITDMVSIFR